MKTPALVLSLLLAAGSAPAVRSQEPGEAPGAAARLEAGDPAPAFSLPGSDGATHTLGEHRGRRAVVIAWFPKAFTGG